MTAIELLDAEIARWTADRDTETTPHGVDLYQSGIDALEQFREKLVATETPKPDTAAGTAAALASYFGRAQQCVTFDDGREFVRECDAEGIPRGPFREVGSREFGIALTVAPQRVERPTEPGWYWARFDAEQAALEIVEVGEKGDVLRDGRTYRVSEFADWRGPLLPPEPVEVK